MAVKIFYCYAHEDEALLKKLQAHLRPLQRQGLIDVWHDRDISAGTEWEQQISRQLNEAQIILLLVSSDFMASDYCYGREMQRALERNDRGEATVIPIILRPVYWQGILGNLQALPKDAKPVISSGWHSTDEALFDIAEGIRKVAQERITRGHSGASLHLLYKEEERLENAQEEKLRKAEEKELMKQILCTTPQNVSVWAYTNMSQIDWVVLDTETTGRPGEIIDVAIINHEGNVIFDSLMKPTVSIPAEATRIHGITDTDVRNAPTFKALWPSLQKLLVGKRIITYNAQFDRNALIFTSKLHQVELPNMEWECLMKAYAKYRNVPDQYGSPNWQTLNEACHQQGIEIIQSHRALGDAWAAYELMKRIAKSA